MNLEYPNCIICKENEFSNYLAFKDSARSSFSLKQCKCSLVLTSPRPCENSIHQYYDKNYLPHSDANSKGFMLNNIFRKISYFWKKKLIIKNIPKKKIVMLDVGAGDGSLALYLRDYIHSVNVYEKNIDCVRYLNKKNIFASDRLTEYKDKSYNLITLFHSLEHIHKMDELFLHINRITTKKAKMIIAVPNVDACENQFLKDDWVAWDTPRHLYHFSPKTLNMLLDKNGWQVIKSKSMFQDTIFNIYMSLKNKGVKKIFIFFVLTIYSALNQIIFSGKQSTNLVICKKK